MECLDQRTPLSDNQSLHQESDENGTRFQQKSKDLGSYRYGVSRHYLFYQSQQNAGVTGIWNAAADNATGHGFPNFNQSRGKLSVSCMFFTLI
jgi:hypothetical protein